MNSSTIAELSKNTGNTLALDDPIIVTNNSKPASIIFNVKGMQFDEIVDFAREVEGLRAIKHARKQSKLLGLDTLTEEEIEAEIAAVRSKK